MSELEKYIPLVRFMGQVFGSDFEIVLHDIRFPEASAYFIKENQELIGLLCVSHNTDALLEAWHTVSALTSSFYLPGKTISEYSEEAGGSMLDISSSRILNTLNSFNVVPQRMSAAEKMDIVRRLDQQGIFSTKGAISLAARYLNVSEPTLYRYLSKVRKENK